MLIAPKQTTYQLERQLLAYPSIAGYTRLHILSFERLGRFIFEQLGRRAPELLEEEGRLMVLRGLLARKRQELKLFRASARLTGFAQQLSLVLRELQQHQLSPESLVQLAAQVQEVEGLAYKLQDLATLLEDYLGWLKAHQLQDADCLLAAAAEALGGSQRTGARSQEAGEGGERREARRQEAGGGSQEAGNRRQEFALNIEQLWVDGFAGWSPQELDLLAALMPHCRQATITFCLDRLPAGKLTWLSNWSVVRKSFEECRRRLSSVPEALLSVETLSRHPNKGRFVNNAVLQHLEQFWAQPQPYPAGPPDSRPESQSADGQGEAGESPAPEGNGSRLPPQPGRLPEGEGEPSPAGRRIGEQGNFSKPDRAVAAPWGEGQGEWEADGAKASRPREGDLRPLQAEALARSLRVALCSNPEAEVTLAAREVLRHVRAGGRYREVTVLVRKLEGYHEALQRIFSRYEIPFFLDRRESVSHHPLAELSRSALRTVAFGWQRDDWFAALKTGLVPAGEGEVDRLENEALARGWQGAVWQKAIVVNQEPELTAWLGELHGRLLPPFQRLALALAARQNKPTGRELAAALRELWERLGVQERLEQWAAAEISRAEFRLPSSVHATVWEQMNAWLENVELAFSTEPLSLREWLPILEAGLANLTVGVIPPALDQVLIGAIDRSRNPDIKLALVLGLNESVFPAPPEASVLLTEADREELERRNLVLGASARQQLGRERYHAYIACTRARERVVLTGALHDAQGAPLNPSPFLWQVRQLFPSLAWEVGPEAGDWRESEHASELVVPLLKAQAQAAGGGAGPDGGAGLSALAAMPGLASVLEGLRHFQEPQLEERLSAALAARLYGRILRTSVSRMEQFAACPFKFFVHSGLRAEERKLFELDVREQGTFQHDVLALFHEQLCREHKRWRDITPTEARERVARIAHSLLASYRDGLLQASEQSRFMARLLSESLEEFVETLVGWMRQQYQFDPIEVELAFGEDESAPAWTIFLEQGQRLELYGRIDRVDVCPEPQTGAALCVVVDYKSGPKQLDPVLLAHGLQLQLLTYLNVLRHWPHPRERFGAERLIPAGVFYVSLRGQYQREQNRRDALADAEAARKLAYRHTGRFDARVLPRLDARPGARQGDQFNYRLTKAGAVDKRWREAMDTGQFEAMLEGVEEKLQQMGRQILAGRAEVAPYRRGAATACDQCDYRSICRIDPWTHHFRVLRDADAGADGG